jgi:SAM-dependent methyltransferase
VSCDILLAAFGPWRVPDRYSDVDVESWSAWAKTMIERKFTEDRLAAVYDAFSPPTRRDDFAFYLPLIVSARAVLDVGCGTGALLRLAREAGHTGRLVGLDPAAGMITQARRRTDIEWVHGDLASVRRERAFDLIVTTGHAFQEFVEDDEIRAALAAIRAALADGGRFAFETRNPLARDWETWPTKYSGEVADASGAIVRCAYQVETPVEGGVVRTVSTFTSPAWERPEISRGALRFIAPEALAAFLAEAGLGDHGAVRGLGQGAAGRDEPGDHHHRAEGLGQPTARLTLVAAYSLFGPHTPLPPGRGLALELAHHPPSHSLTACQWLGSVVPGGLPGEA